MNVDFSGALSLKRFPFLDAARGVACIGVVACHCKFAHYFHWYWGVMDFFFVMSGFLITRSLIANSAKGRGTLAFFLYRALRLLPAYLTVMVLYELVIYFLGTKPPWESLPYVFFYQHLDVVLGDKEIFPRVHEMIPFWSLVVEEHYYLLWGILFCTFAHAKLKITPATIGGVVLLLALAIALRKVGVNWWTLPGRYDGFLLGSIAGMIIFTPQKVHLSEKTVRWLMALGWIVCGAAFVRLVWSSLLSYRDVALFNEGRWIDVSCFSIFSVLLVLGMVKLDIRRVHFGKLQDACAFIGLISYEIYLVHFPIVSILESHFDFEFNSGGIVLFVVTVVLSTVIAHLMHKALTASALKQREGILAYIEARLPRKRPARQEAPVDVPLNAAAVSPACHEPAGGHPERND